MQSQKPTSYLKKFNQFNHMKLKSTIATVLLVTPAFSGIAQIAITGAVIDTSASTQGLAYNATEAKKANSGNWPAGTYNYKFGDSSGYTDNVKTLKSFTAGGEGYTYASGVTSVVKIKRVENASFATYWSTYGGAPLVTPTRRDLAYYESETVGSNIKIKAPYTPKMEDLFQSNNIAIGIDNMFANDYVTNFNNIERMDVVIPAGLLVQVPAAQGFALFERGDYNAHDPSKVALITAIDANGNPTAYATSVMKIVTANYYDSTFTANRVYQPSNFTNGNWAILRRDDSTGLLQVSDKVSLSQGIGGVMVKFSDFGVTAGTTVYGYSVLGGDFPDAATGSNVVDYTNTTYFPTTTPGTTGAGGNDMAVITGIVKILKISGNIYHDPNGLTDNVINGLGIGIASGTQLYVNLVDANNKVVGVATVSLSGAFEFDKLAFGNITAQISTTAGVIGQTAPTPGLPSGWSSVGENFGTNNRAGTGNEAGVSNSIIPIRMGDQNITDIAFGIEQTPTSDAISYSILQPAPNQIIVLNGSYGGTTPPNQLTGSDPEDGPGTHGLQGNATNRKVIITSLPTNGQLYYNGILVTAGQVIPNYKKDSLSIKFTGSGYTSVAFNYAYVDNAGVASTPASYTLFWNTPLPLTLVSFTARLENSIVKLEWKTATEQNIQGFQIEKSTDAKTWTVIGFQKTLSKDGNSTTALNYSFDDINAIANANYYRLAEIENNQSVKYSDVRVVMIGKNSKVVIYPNPASDKVYFSTNDWSVIQQINLTDMSGRVITTVSNAKDGLQLNVPAGNYLIQIVHTNGTVTTSKITKK
jgi:hypothetical protein